MGTTKDDRLAKIHAEAMEEFDQIQAAQRDERLQCLKDRRFYSIAGAQWEGPLGEQFENKPKFEVNKIHLSVIRIFNEYRNNRITVDFTPKDGSKSDKLADTCNGLYRADEQDSWAQEAYDNAFEEAVGGGIGAWRLRTAYEDDEDLEDERQRIRIEPIFDADSCVFFDLGAKRQDKSDAKRCYVLTAMSPDAYRDEYDDDPASWPKDVSQSEFDWSTPDAVFVAEYYVVENKRETSYVYRSPDGEEERFIDSQFDADEDLEDRLLATGYRKVREKKLNVRRVHKYIMSGAKVLEDCGYIAGKCIPIVVTYGKRWYVDNIERCMGHVRLATDAQRLKNMQLSKLGEISALSSIEKPILTPEQVAGHQLMWADDNIKNYPYLLINPITDSNGQLMVGGPVAYTKPPQIPPAMAALLQITEQDMQDLLGNQQAGDELQANVSGKAVELIQNRLDMQTYIYMSNMSKAIKRSGEIWLSMAKDVFVEPKRKMKTVGAQGQIGSVELLRPVIDPESGEQLTENDVAKAALDVFVDVGPSSDSKRAATVRALTGMAAITDDPETKQVIGAMAMMNMEGEGIGEAREYFRKRLLKMGVVEPTEEERMKMASDAANAKPTPNDQYLQSAAAAEDARAAKAKADTVLTIAKAQETQAKTTQIASEIDAGEQRQALEVIDRFNGQNNQSA